jgi:hypothetical protein
MWEIKHNTGYNWSGIDSSITIVTLYKPIHNTSVTNGTSSLFVLIEGLMKTHSFINHNALCTYMSIKITLAILAIAAVSLTAMGSIDIVVTTAIAQNTTAGATDTSNMTTFEENMTGAGNTTSGGNWTK